MTGAYVRHALFTAFRIARFDNGASEAFDHSFEGFFRSFFAAFLSFPIHVFLVVTEQRILAAADYAQNRALAEEGLTEGDIPELVAKRYLGPIISDGKRPDCLVLGCTHFPALSGVIARVAGPEVKLVDSAATTADAVERLLNERNLRREGEPVPPRFLATDAPERFARVGEIFLGARIAPETVELVDLQRL